MLVSCLRSVDRSVGARVAVLVARRCDGREETAVSPKDSSRVQSHLTRTVPRLADDGPDPRLPFGVFVLDADALTCLEGRVPVMGLVLLAAIVMDVRLKLGRLAGIEGFWSLGGIADVGFHVEKATGDLMILKCQSGAKDLHRGVVEELGFDGVDLGLR